MANGGGQHAPPAIATPVGTPKPSSNPHTSQSEAVQSKRDLTSWWKAFKRKDGKIEEPKSEHKDPEGIFGVPLHVSIRYANVAISLFNDEGVSYIYGYVPIVVAKCGVFLKERATETEGIFRLAGSEKRIKELKVAFDSSKRYGKGLDWTGYTVHDAANILRRYFNQLPEPIIPLDFYERFRAPLRNHQQQAVGQTETQSPDSGDFDQDAAIRAYQGLITELPPLNRQLLLYILDLLAVFASKSDLNKMTTPNLAAIFQPGILSHPQHDMAPQEYRLSQDVLIFLIENQDSFLIGMTGTAADEKTVKEVQSGYQRQQQQSDSPTVPGRSKTVIGRTASNASGGSQSNRVFSGIRRNVSTSSRNSRQSSIPPGSPSLGSPSLAGGVHRSNTVPSQRPSASPRYSARDKGSDPPTPNTKLPPPVESVGIGEEAPEEPSQHLAGEVSPSPLPSPAPAAIEEQPATPDAKPTSFGEGDATAPVAAAEGEVSAAALVSEERFDRENKPSLLTPEAAKRDRSHERSGARNFLDRFRPGGTDQTKEPKPKKLQKKRVPGSNLSSAHSSSHDLGEEEESTGFPLASPTTPQYRDTDPMNEAAGSSAPRTMSRDTPQQRIVSDNLRPDSPHQSEPSRASVTDASDAEFVDEQAANEKQEKKKRWRFSHSARSRHGDASPEQSKGTPPMPAAGSPDTRRTSSGASPALHGEPHHASTNESLSTEHSGVLSDTEEKKKGPMSWIRGKIQERKEKEAEKRAKSPSQQDHRHSVATSRDTADQSERSGEGSRRGSHAQLDSVAPAEAQTHGESQAGQHSAAHLDSGAQLQAPGSSGVSPAGTPTPTPSTANVTAETEPVKELTAETEPTAEAEQTPPAKEA